jgi:hypothetical protein
MHFRKFGALERTVTSFFSASKGSDHQPERMTSLHCELIKLAGMILVGKAQRRVPLDRLAQMVEY